MRKFPSYYDPTDVGKFYEPRTELAIAEGRAADVQHSADKKPSEMWTALFGTDPQTGFVLEGYKLTVPGAIEATRRVIEMIYQYPEKFDEILYTLDLHEDLHIFFPSWWVDSKGNHPKPFTKITAEDVIEGRWKSVIMQEWSIYYVCKLGEIDIWPPHMRIGTKEPALVPAFAEAVAWHSAARNVKPIVLPKGLVIQSEFYGPFRPCVIVPGHPQGDLNTGFLNLLARYEKVFDWGFGENYCLRHSIMQRIEYFEGRPDVIERIHLLKDGTALIPSETREEADRVLDEFAKKGVKIIATTEICN